MYDPGAGGDPAVSGPHQERDLPGPDADADAHSYAHSYAHPDPDPYSYSYADSNPYTHTHTHPAPRASVHRRAGARLGVLLGPSVHGRGEAGDRRAW